jgi:hypothetical protein
MTAEYSTNDNYKVFRFRNKSKELDFIKELDQIIEQYNKEESGHYILRLVKALKRGWY